MIWGVRYLEVEQYLFALGFHFEAETTYTLVYRRGSDYFTIVKPSERNGSLPIIYVDAAFDAAGLPMPTFEQSWCD